MIWILEHSVTSEQCQGLMLCASKGLVNSGRGSSTCSTFASVLRRMHFAFAAYRAQALCGSTSELTKGVGRCPMATRAGPMSRTPTCLVAGNQSKLKVGVIFKGLAQNICHCTLRAAPKDCNAYNFGHDAYYRSVRVLCHRAAEHEQTAFVPGALVPVQADPAVHRGAAVHTVATALISCVLLLKSDARPSRQTFD